MVQLCWVAVLLTVNLDGFGFGDPRDHAMMGQFGADCRMWDVVDMAELEPGNLQLQLLYI
jgi:hypothetical protein